MSRCESCSGVLQEILWTLQRFPYVFPALNDCINTDVYNAFNIHPNIHANYTYYNANNDNSSDNTNNDNSSDNTNNDNSSDNTNNDNISYNNNTVNSSFNNNINLDYSIINNSNTIIDIIINTINISS